MADLPPPTKSDEAPVRAPSTLLRDYTVTQDDGSKITFRGPSNMTDDQVYLRADMERKLRSGEIPTTFWGGAKKGEGEYLAEHGPAHGTAIGLAANLVPNPVGAAVLAASPLIGRGVQAVGESMAGRPQTPLQRFELPIDAAEGVAMAYGPGAIARGAHAFSGAVQSMSTPTLPQALGKAVAATVPVGPIAEKLTPEALQEAGGNVASGVSSAAKALAARAIRTGDAVAEKMFELATRLHSGLSAEDVELFNAHLEKGYTPSNAARIVGESDPRKVSGLLSIYMRAKGH